MATLDGKEVEQKKLDVALGLGLCGGNKRRERPDTGWSTQRNCLIRTDYCRLRYRGENESCDYYGAKRKGTRSWNEDPAMLKRSQQSSPSENTTEAALHVPDRQLRLAHASVVAVYIRCFSARRITTPLMISSIVVIARPAIRATSVSMPPIP